MEKKKLLTIGLLALVYGLFTGGSYFLFSQTSLLGGVLSSPVPAPSKTADGGVAFDATLPKTEVCPLNGAKYSKQQRAWWEKHSPLGVMVENHLEARPQSGISSADVVYEAVAEGGITRFLVVYYCQDAKLVGPVRSARTYFLDFISEYGANPLYAHVGGANTAGPADALSQINNYGWGGYNDMNQFSIGFPTFWRDDTRLRDSFGNPAATEHTMYSTTTKLWEFAAKDREITDVDADGASWKEEFVQYSFKEDASVNERGKSQKIHAEPWEGYKEYAVDWTYDPITNAYKRAHGANPHLDKNTNKQLEAKTVVVLSMQESNANDGYENNAHLLYRTKGSGKATIFIDGKQIVGTWEKESRTARMQIFDASGEELEFNRGLLWFEVLPTDGVLKVT